MSRYLDFAKHLSKCKCLQSYTVCESAVPLFVSNNYVSSHVLYTALSDVRYQPYESVKASAAAVTKTESCFRGDTNHTPQLSTALRAL